jgi:uncharacterized membrane protein YkvA (DUF1232 family)
MPVDHAAAWEGLDERTAPRAARDEARVRRGFWSKAKRVAARLPFAEDLLSAYYCAFDRTTPIQVKAALLGALAYFVLPVDLVPDILPVLGVDTAAVPAAALRLVASHIRPEHHEAARSAGAASTNSSAADVSSYNGCDKLG